VVAADIKNVGTSAGAKSITYTLTREKNTTTATNTTNVTLAGRTATTVSFTTPTTGLELGEYVATVNTKTDTSSQNITLEPAQAVEEDTGGSGGGGGGGGGQPSLADAERENFTIQRSSQSATEIQQGESISVSAEIKNTGDKGGQQIQLLLNGTQRATKTVLLQPRETRTVTFDDVTVDEPSGEYTYQIVTNDDTTEGTITVSTDNGPDTAAPETTTGENGTATTDPDTNGSNTTRDSQSERESPETVDQSPGFGVSVAIISLLLVAGLLRSRL
jgi:PGF-CTERM protein